MIPLKYPQAYPASLQSQARQLIAENRLGKYLKRCYPRCHDVQGGEALYACTMNLKQERLRSAPGLDKVPYDNKFGVAQHAPGLHATISWMQGGKLEAKGKIRMTSLFKDTTPEFLRMIIVREFAHLKRSKHDRALYQLYQYMPPGYHQLEFDLWMHLTWKSF